MIIGCNTVLFASLDLKEALRHIALAGFEAAELACLGNVRHVWPDFDDEQIAQTKSILDESGLKIVAMEAVADLTDPKARAWFYSALRLAKALGVPLVSTGSGGKDTEEDLRGVEAAIPEVAAEAERMGVKVSVKAHVHAAVHDVESALRVVHAANSRMARHQLRRHPPLPGGRGYLRRVGPPGAPRRPHPLPRPARRRRQADRPADQPGPRPRRPRLPPLLRRIVDSGYAGALDLEVIGAFDYPGDVSLGIAAQIPGVYPPLPGRDQGRIQGMTNIPKRISALRRPITP